MVTENLPQDTARSRQTDNEEVLVKVDHVSKKFCRRLKKALWYGVQDISSEMIGRKYEHQLRPDEFWAIDDVSFELKRGECLGLIGPNGAGKSTLLKMLNGLIKPDKGSIMMRGRVNALIELMAGFNPILTGLENIYSRAAILGLSKAEIESKLDDIIEFSEIGDFLHAPVQSYSSGMKVRLGFAIAAQLEPDVLILDEVLAVGDVGFRSKCYNRIYDLLQNCAVIFVSHAMPQVARLCTQVALLKEGRTVEISKDGPKVIQRYLDLFDTSETREIESDGSKIDNLTLPNAIYNNGCYEISFLEDLSIEFDAWIQEDYENLEVSISFISQWTQLIAQCSSLYDKVEIANLGKKIHISLSIPRFNLNPSLYYLSLVVRDCKTNKMLIWYHSKLKLKVNGDFYGSAPTQFRGEWSLNLS